MLQLKCLGQDLEDMEFMESPEQAGGQLPSSFSERPGY
jgi:hypothetical protein